MALSEKSRGRTLRLFRTYESDTCSGPLKHGLERTGEQICFRPCFTLHRSIKKMLIKRVRNDGHI